MSEQQGVSVSSPQQSTVGPPVQAASQIAVSSSLAELIVTFGQTKPVLDSGSGQFTNTPAVEWLISMSIALPIAVNLRNALDFAIKEYEKRFGTIPSDPSLHPKTSLKP